MDVMRAPLACPQIHDFAVIWDEDHDSRVIQAVEAIYMAGLLSPVQFIGERKGMLHVIVAAKFYWGGANMEQYREQIEEIAQRLDDPWTVEIGSFDRSLGSPHQCDTVGIVADSEDHVLTYFRSIDHLWCLGTKPYVQAAGQRLGSCET